MDPFGRCESHRYSSGREQVDLFVPPMNTLFFGAQKRPQMVFLDLNHSLGRVESSDLVQNGRNNSPDVVGGL